MAKSPRLAKNPESAVGYGKPPRHTQFKPGQSGNPKGRAKGTKNLKTDLIEELGEKIVIREGDRTQKVSKQRAVVKSLVNRTLKGDTRAGNLLISMMMRLVETGEAGDDAPESLTGDELEILRSFEERVKRKSLGGAPSTSRNPNMEQRS